MRKSRKLLLVILLLIWFSYFENNTLTTTKIDVKSADIPPSFDGFRIVQLSDLHSKLFGKNQSRLIERVKKENPDIILFTGDLVDSNKNDERHLNISLTLMKELVAVAPVYFVSGNHEWGSWDFPQLERQLEAIGVRVLRNEADMLKRGTDAVVIAGIDDPLSRGGNRAATEEELQEALHGIDTRTFTVLLAHRPEYFSLYSPNSDLIFSGHAHGGQIRLPFIGGVVAPGQGLFPTLTAGKYEQDGSNMIVSRGLGNSRIPQRVFNRPEVVVVTLNQE